MMKRWIAAAAVIMLAVPAHADVPVPLDPDNPAVAEQWVNPQIRAGEGSEGLTLSLIDATTARIRNDSDSPADGLTITPRRGPNSGSVYDATVATIAQPGEYTPAGPAVEVPPLGAGEEVEIPFTVDLPPQTQAATFPMMLVLAQDGAILDTERWHTWAEGPLLEGHEPTGMSVLFPVSTTIDTVPGETGEAPNRPPLILYSEQLADQLAPGGRLDELVEVYSGSVARQDGVGYASCLALDPALVDTVDRMAQGYLVDDDRPAPGRQRQRLRDSWGNQDPASADSTPGKGSKDAAAWLDKVKAAAQSGCTVALPWANADLNAVARTGDKWLMREALERGPFTLERVLGTPAARNVVVPGAGYLTPEAAAAMGWADHSRSDLSVSGMQRYWEEEQARTRPAQQPNLQSTLDSPTLPVASAAPAPEQPVQVLVADNTIPSRFTSVMPGVVAVGYQADLASTLAATGSYPETTGYSQENLRFNYAVDSTAARDLTAATAVRTAAMTAAEPVMVAPPAGWDASTARHVMDAVGQLVESRTVTPMSLADYTRLPGDTAEAPAAGAPYNDPTVYSDAEILNAGQQAQFIDDLTALLANDPAIALTRYGYTLPLRAELLNALTVTHRRAYTFYTDAENRTRNRLNRGRDTLAGIRASISLIPPGNVYTRTSESSPLLIVAENGLPLPVDASILYRGPEDATLNTPAEFTIPARGSLTLQMTANLPQDAERTDLQLFLATPNKRPISQPVDIAVQTAGGAFANWILVAALAGLFALAVLFQLGKRRRDH